MKPSIVRLLSVTLLAAAFATATAQTPPAKPTAPAATKPAAGTPPAADAAAPAKKNRYPFHGIVKATDAKAMTITLEGKDHDRVLHLSGESHLSKDAKDITLSGVATSDYLHGSVQKNDRGEEVITKAQAGPKPAPKPKTNDDDAKKAKKDK